jgi:hypothetical protein
LGYASDRLVLHSKKGCLPTMGKRKRRKTTPVVQEAPESSAFVLMLREVGDKIRPQSGSVLMVLAFAHLLVGLAFLGVVANHYSATDTAVFGVEVPDDEAQRVDASSSPVSPTASGLFGLFNVVVWGFLFFRRRDMDAREIRLLAMLLGPGTVMAITVIALAVAHRG